MLIFSISILQKERKVCFWSLNLFPQAICFLKECGFATLEHFEIANISLPFHLVFHTSVVLNDLLELSDKI